jgi:hypothetical protein
MPDQGVDIKVRVLGARKAAGETDRITGSLDRLGRRGGRSMRLFGTATASATRGISSSARVVGGLGIAIGGGLAIEVKKATDAWEESRKVTAQTGAVLHSTRHAAHVTSDEVGALANTLSRKAGVDDELIQSGENMLLTFTNVRNEAGRGNAIFDRSTQTLLDMSVALGEDMPHAAIQLGKALNNPTEGMNALRRVGVTFDKDQQKRIKTLQKAGDITGAQRLILRELNKEFGGSAAAQATPLDKLKVSAGNLQEAIGHGVSPAVDALASDLQHFTDRATPDLERLSGHLEDIFKRTDIGTGRKVELALHASSRTVRPYVHELGDELQRAHLGDKLADAFEAAAPRIADAAARSAPRAAGAFVNAFAHAGPWGQLLTLAFLAKRLGAFGGAGSMAANLFASRYRTSLAANGALKGAAGTQGAALGTTFGEQMAIAAGVAIATDLNFHVVDAISHELDKLPGPLRTYAKTVFQLNPVAGAKRAFDTGKDLVTGHPGKALHDLGNSFGIGGRGAKRPPASPNSGPDSGLRPRSPLGQLPSAQTKGVLARGARVARAPAGGHVIHVHSELKLKGRAIAEADAEAKVRARERG